MTGSDAVIHQATWRGTSILVGLSRAQERRLRNLWLEEWGLQVAARCGSAAELLEALQSRQAGVALVDEDLHRLDSDHRAAMYRAGTPLVALVREMDDVRWRDVPGLVLPLEADLPVVLDALGRAAGGERHSQKPKLNGTALESTVALASMPGGARQVAAGPSRIQVLALWAGGCHAGSTLLACSCAAMLGSAAPTVLVDLDVSGAAVGVHLDDGQQGRVRSSLLDLLSADLDSHEAWQREIERSLQPLGPYAKHAHVLCGLPRRRERAPVSAAFVERLVAELRTRFAFVVLDVGSESPAESQVTAAALRAADQVFVIATPDPPGLHRAGTSVRDAAALLDRGRAALVLNRYDQRVHTDVRRVDAEIGLPIVSLVPEDTRSVQRALLAGHPAVCEPGSRIRRPLLDLMDRVAAGHVAWPGHLEDPWAAPRLWTRMRTALASAPISLIGGTR